MKRTRSAILALSLLGVFPHAAWAQPGTPPTDVAAVSATVGVEAVTPAVGAKAAAGTAAAGGGSGAPSLDAAATVRTADVDASARTTVGADRSGSPKIALDVSVDTKTSTRASRPTVEHVRDQAAAPSTRANGRSAEPGKAKSKARSTDARARAERSRRAHESVTRAVPDAVERAPLSLEAPVDTTWTPSRPAADANLNTGGPSPDEAAPSAGGVSGVATLLSLAILLIPLASWAIELGAAGSPGRRLISFLERPG
jgi:hypothetical protein